MLTDLSIRNIAIIEQLQLTLGPGLTTLTGETGAGKSIIIDSLSLLSGGRAASDLIRSGEEEATVEAVFDISGQPELGGYLTDAGIAHDGELLVKRIVNRSGRNRIYLNGSLATLAQLADIGRRLITIHGQHESQTLLKPESHLLLLDSFAACGPKRRELAEAFDAWQALEQQTADFEAQERDAAHRLDLLAFQCEEIEQAALKPGEDDELAEEQRVLAHAGRLAAITGSAFESLYGGDRTILGELRRLTATLHDAAAIDPALTGTTGLLEESFHQLEEAALRLRDYAGRLEADPERLRHLEDRLDQIGRLKKKYGSTIEEIIDLGETLGRERDELLGRSRSQEELERAVAAARSRVETLGAELSAVRRQAAERLRARLVVEVRQLAMPHAEVTVAFEPLSQPRASGCERVEFLFSPNPGEPPRALGKVASGGELSRLMLAFKQVLPEGEAPTLVFDEVDTGIGGAVAGVVGKKLRNLAAGQQVFCITHLPQVAACADRHLRVEKAVVKGRTTTTLTPLDHGGRITELARMMAGEKVTDTALEHAADLLAHAASE